jgi:hypothetical protein
VVKLMTLFRPNLSEHGKGNYTCIVKNLNGRIERDFMLEVVGKKSLNL